MLLRLWLLSIFGLASCQLPQNPPPTPSGSYLRPPLPDDAPLDDDAPGPDIPIRPLDNNVLNRLYDMADPSAHQHPIHVSRLNQLINHLGNEIEQLHDHSKQLFNENIRGLNRIKILRDGLRYAYRDIFQLQNSLYTYQSQLRELQQYLKTHHSKVVVVDDRSLGQLYGLIDTLKLLVDGMVNKPRHHNNNPPRPPLPPPPPHHHHHHQHHDQGPSQRLPPPT